MREKGASDAQRPACASGRPWIGTGSHTMDAYKAAQRLSGIKTETSALSFVHRGKNLNSVQTTEIAKYPSIMSAASLRYIFILALVFL